jgi:hypothetical protein
MTDVKFDLLIDLVQFKLCLWQPAFEPTNQRVPTERGASGDA